MSTEKLLTALALTTLFSFAAAREPWPMSAGPAGPAPANFADLLFLDDFNTDECEPYEERPRFITPSGSWSSPGNVQFQTFTVQATQRGGGIVDATLNSGHVADIKPRLVACVDTACTGGSIVDHFRIEQFGNAPEGDYPIDYNMTVDYGDRLDCWEPNNRIEDARLIQQERSVFAYMIEGYVENDLPTADYADWYRFTLREQGRIRIEIRQPPGDHRLRIQVFDRPDGNVASVLMDDAIQPVPGQPYTSISANPVPPGVYYVQIGLALQDSDTVRGDDPEPPHWTEEYELFISSTPTP